MALICHFGQIVTGFLAPLVIYLLKKDDSKYVAFHALESLYFSVAILLAVMVIGSVTCGLGALLIPIAWVCNLVAGLKAMEGKYWEYPIVGKLAREQIYK